MVAFINCCKAKASVKTKARLLYQSWFFKAMLKYVSEKVGENQVYILSAKYGILGLDDKVEPYNLKLTEQTENDWAEMVFNQAKERGIDLENAVYYCASAYYEPIKRKLETVKGGGGKFDHPVRRTEPSKTFRTNYQLFQRRRRFVLSLL